MSSDLRRTPLYATHVRLGGRMVPFAGWEMPIQFSGISAEHHAVRRAAGLFDVSHMGELEIRGAGALGLLQFLITGDVEKIADGQALYTCACNAEGTILDDLIVYRRSPTDFLVVCNASNRAKIVAHFQGHARPDAGVRDASDELALLALQGPKAFDVWEAAGGSAELRAGLGSFHFAPAELGGLACVAARTGYTGEDGLELFVAADLAERFAARLLEAGTPLGLAPVGLGARDTLRLEARLSLYGNDIDETTNPLEAGLGWIVKLGKPDFLGKAALVAIREHGVTRKLVGFEMTGRGIARHGYPLLDDGGAVVGACTSGGPSPTLGKNIGLGYLPLALGALGTAFAVDCRGKSVSALVVATPFYRRPGSARKEPA